MLWTLAFTVPVICSALFYYIVLTPWHCSGICCLHEASCPSITTVQGSYEPKFTPVVKSLEDSFNKGWNIGASMYVVVDNQPVIDVAGGFRDKQKTIPYDTSTINVVFSCGKIIESIAIAILVDKGLVDLDAPVAQYWPEFAQKGKGGVTVKDILSHRSGTSYQVDEYPSVSILENTTERDNFVAEQEFPYPRGTVAYRGWSSAFVTDAVCRRVDPQSRSLATLVHDELFSKFGEDFISPPVPEHQKAKFSEVHDVSISTILLGVLPQAFSYDFYSKIIPDGHPIKLDPDYAKAIKAAILKTKHEDGFSYFDRADLPDTDLGAVSFNNHSSFLSYNMMSGNSVSNARSLGKALNAFMNGDIVQKSTLESFLDPFPNAFDRFFGKNFTYTVGGLAINPDFLPLENVDCTGWFGMGGCMLFYCTVGEHKVTFSFVLNAVSPTFYPRQGLPLLDMLTKVLSA